MADSISDLQKDTFYWQRLLRLAGYYHGAIDGIPGNGTRNGTERWSTDADRYKMEIGCFDAVSYTHLTLPTTPYV